MKKPIGYFWHANQSHIYSELLKLEEQGLVTYQVMEQQNRPDKKLYTITEAGLATLRRWVTEPVEIKPDRSELLLKAYTVWLAEPEKAAQLFRSHEDYHTRMLAKYEQILEEFEKEHGPEWEVDIPLFGDYATLQRGIGYEREYAAWCRWMAEQLEKHSRSISSE